MTGKCMNRAVFVFIWVFVFLALFPDVRAEAEPAGKSGQQGDGPVMALDRTKVELGAATEGEVISARFTLKNEGAGTLMIHKVKSGCACTRVDCPRTVPAGKAADIAIEIDTLGIHGRRIFKTAIYSNDPERPVLLLRVKADVRPLLTLKPDRFFLKGSAGAAIKKDILIHTSGHMPLEVRIEQNSLGDKVVASLKPVVKGQKYRLSVENRVKEAGSFRGRLILQTNYPGREHIAVPVFVYLPAPVSVIPEILALQPGRCPKCRDDFSGEVLVRANDDRPLKILSVNVPAPGCEYEKESLIPGQAYRIRVECMNCKDCQKNYFLDIQTNREDYKQIKVPVVLEEN